MSEDRVDEYGYNIRNELISAAKNAEDVEYRYQYDDIGNRISSHDLGTNRTYTVNNLNQYTSISNSAPSALSAGETFIPHFDDDGNQTLIQTATGIWRVQYNGENRPILWENVSTNSLTPSLISMSYDRMGRRVTKNDQRFVYDGYLQIANSELQTFVWDPTEPVATRPLVWNSDNCTSFYTHDGNKNVSEVIQIDGVTIAHYEYTPFGAVFVKSEIFSLHNIWQYSSEYFDADVAVVHYNYRNYNAVVGRWLNRDPLFDRAFGFIMERGRLENEYKFIGNDGTRFFDYLGLDNPGCDLPNFILKNSGSKRNCFRRCCAKHDECYYTRNGSSPGGKCPCTAGSWGMNSADVYMRMNGGRDLFGNDPCKKCNSDAVSCFARCLVDNGEEDPIWFCPNGEHAGETFYTWESLPSSCFESGQKPNRPPDEDPPPPPPPPYDRPSMPELFDALYFM